MPLPRLAGEKTVLLPYTHFSGLMRLDKRLAAVTGMGIDGSKLMDMSLGHRHKELGKGGRPCIGSTHPYSKLYLAKLAGWVSQPYRDAGLSKAAVQRGLSPPIPDLRVNAVLWQADPRTTRRYDRSRHKLAKPAGYDVARALA